MKFNFKIQDYQTDAVNAIVRVFSGQGFRPGPQYRRDVGTLFLSADMQLSMEGSSIEELSFDDMTGYRNEEISLTDEQLFRNIQDIQQQNNIALSPALAKDLGRCSLDIEMETGTGKTYVYIKTMFELNKQCGWSKFIVVVPSIAIREGVKKSFEMTVEHFMEHYGKKARFFVYSSSNLNQLDNFSAGSGIHVMIINTQAFARSFAEAAEGKKKSKEQLIIYDKRDEFGSRRPIDVIKANRPILILDEPQKMGGEVTQKALRNFNPLFSLNFSATHAKQHNLVYVLDALDAYNKRLVKRIEVKGFEVKNLLGTNGYLYLQQIILSPKAPPMARIELEVKHKDHMKRELHKVGVEDNLYVLSNQAEEYRDLYVKYIDPIRGTVTFSKDIELTVGESIGDVHEEDERRVQIRETILSHFEKEERLFQMGIKTLSLFFIDEVAKYRQYNEAGEEQLGEYGRIFEQEYLDVLNDHLTMEDTPYQRYLREYCSDIPAVHNGYFSIDKKTGHSVNSELKRGSEFSDDISAYDLILKNKERLLSFEEPTRFIFSHSALREGWDNPNVFQICTLKHSDSNTAKRQEVGRGMRLCVNQEGSRMDAEVCGDSVQDVNLLTVIASESYKGFVSALQSDIKSVLYHRPTKASREYFAGKVVPVNGKPQTITDADAQEIYFYLIQNGYINTKEEVTDKYREDQKSGTLAPLPMSLADMSEGIHKLVQAVYDDSVLAGMFTNAHQPKVTDNPLNENFRKAEFQALWKEINHQYSYTVSFKSEELIEKAIASINSNLLVTKLLYTTSAGSQKATMVREEVDAGESFALSKTRTQVLRRAEASKVKYDLIGKVAAGTVLTRRTVAKILSGISKERFAMFKYNPEDFIAKVTKLILEQKAALTVAHIQYNQTEGSYNESIFTMEKSRQSLENAFRAHKAIQDYVFVDGYAQNGESRERTFAQALENAGEVCVYAKLPKGFAIPTPVGNYSPDWAIAFYEGTVKHIYFIAETKGSMESLDYRGFEATKIACAKKLFNKLSTSRVRYHNVATYDDLMSVMESLD